MSKIEVIDFFASWCGPCRIMKPAIEEIEKQYEDKLTLHKYDIDENQEIAQKYSVMSIPTVLILKEGKVINQFVGAQSKETLTKAIDSVIE